MGHVNTVFHQILAEIPRALVEKVSRSHQADHYVKSFTTWGHLVTMLFAQATGKDSLRDLEAAFNSNPHQLYHLGVGLISRSTLADANTRRPYQVFEQLYLQLFTRFLTLMPQRKFKFKNPFFSFDSTFIDLCLAAFPWAKFRKRKGAIKLHFRLNQESILPSLLVVTHGKTHDLKAAPELAKDLQPDSIVTFDKGYMDFNFLFSLENRRISFVTRVRADQDYTVIGQQEVLTNKNILADQTIVLNGPKSKESYPKTLRLVKIYDPERNKTLTFLTNNFKLAASTIAQIYKLRWQIEIFFKWIKQNLKIKSFLGTSRNAVMTQIWTAMIYYLILNFIKAQTRYSQSLHLLTEIFSLNLFRHVSILDLLSLDKNSLHILDPTPVTQLKLPLRL
jgi:hypothetical protein